MSLDYLDYKLGGENPMGNIPNSCIACMFESSCNTGINLPDCRFYGISNEKISFIKRLKNFFGKLFK